MLKGKAIIQLFDKDTGKEVYNQESSNIVTNCYKNLVKPNILLDLGMSNSYRFNMSSITPMVNKLFGGILLFSEPIEPLDADNFMITKSMYKNFVGNAGSPWNGNSIYRGSLNENESGRISDTEYKLVFDFPSNSANGKIRNLSLCPKFLGNAGLIKDLNDTSNTTIINTLGKDFEDAKIERGSYSCHYFHSHTLSDLGYYLYSKDSFTNVYAKRTGKIYTFTEVTKTNQLGLDTNFATAQDTRDTNLYTYKTYELDYSEESSIPEANYLEVYQNHIFFVSPTNNKGDITFKLFRIKLADYTKDEGITYNLNISAVGNSTLYPKCINNKIYFTASASLGYLYIYDLSDRTFKSIGFSDTTNSYIPIKFYDTVALIYRTKHTFTTPIFILGDDYILYRNNLYISTDSNDYPCFNRIHTNNETMSYPLANATTGYNVNNYGLSELEVQLIMPCLSTINNIDEVTKNSSNVMKITYILTEV